jgi:hypothetical protein
VLLAAITLPTIYTTKAQGKVEVWNLALQTLVVDISFTTRLLHPRYPQKRGWVDLTDGPCIFDRNWRERERDKGRGREMKEAPSSLLRIAVVSKKPWLRNLCWSVS